MPQNTFVIPNNANAESMLASSAPPRTSCYMLAQMDSRLHGNDAPYKIVRNISSEKKVQTLFVTATGVNSGDALYLDSHAVNLYGLVITIFCA
jgi:hypothetical protein